VAEAVQIAVIGCGAIGLPIAVAFASRGAEVLGVDNDAQVIAKLAAADTQLLDDGLQDAMKGSLAAGNLRFEQSLGHYSDRRVFVLAVPTPVNDRGGWIREGIDDAFAQTLSVAQDDDLAVVLNAVTELRWFRPAQTRAPQLQGCDRTVSHPNRKMCGITAAF